MARAADAAVVVLGKGVDFFGEVDAAETELIYEVEVVMNNDVVMPLLRNQREQAFRIDGFGVGLAQVEQIKSFLEEGIDYRVFLDEEVWSR